MTFAETTVDKTHGGAYAVHEMDPPRDTFFGAYCYAAIRNESLLYGPTQRFDDCGALVECADTLRIVRRSIPT